MYKIVEKSPIQEDENDSEIEFYLCSIIDEVTQEEKQEVILHKSEVELYEMLAHLQKSLSLYPQTMQEIWSKIKSYGDLRRNELVINSIKEALKLNKK
jgi:hypothetical protein